MSQVRFGSRLVRLWLWEILRRLGLPPVELVPTRSTEIEPYLEALRACDAGNLRPLTFVWQDRLAHVG